MWLWTLPGAPNGWGRKRCSSSTAARRKRLPARAEEVEHAKEEGIVFHLLNNPTQILGDDQGNVKGMECIRMELGEPDESGRRRPVEVPGSEFVLDVDCVIMAIGTSPNPLIKSTTKGLETQRWGGIVVEEIHRPHQPGGRLRRR